MYQAKVINDYLIINQKDLVLDTGKGMYEKWAKLISRGGYETLRDVYSTVRC